MAIPPATFKDTLSHGTFDKILVDEISRLYRDGHDLRYTKRVHVGEDVVAQQMELPFLLDLYCHIQNSILMRKGPPITWLSIS